MRARTGPWRAHSTAGLTWMAATRAAPAHLGDLIGNRLAQLLRNAGIGVPPVLDEDVQTHACHGVRVVQAAGGADRLSRLTPLLRGRARCRRSSARRAESR